MANVRGVLCACALLWPTLAWSASARMPSSIPRVRPLTALAAEFVARGVGRSPTFASLVARLGQLDTIVYVDLVPHVAGAPDGGTRFLSASRAFRFLSISINEELPPAALVALLGHELQHALEVAEASDIRSAEAFERYYRRAGLVERDGRRICSNAARATGQRVREELATPPSPLVERTRAQDTGQGGE